MPSSQLVISGIDASDEVLQRLAADLNLEILDATELVDIAQRLEAAPPFCFLVDCNIRQSKELCTLVRRTDALGDVPLVAVVGDPWSREVGDSFALGVDDFVAQVDFLHIKQKLQAVRREGAPEGTYLSGIVLLADPQPERRVQLARHLRKLGMEVQFAADLFENGEDGAAKLVVAAWDVEPDGAVAALTSFRETGGTIPWIICGTKEELLQVRAAVAEGANVGFLDLDSDSAQIAFVANKLLIGAQQSQRRSLRLTFEQPICYKSRGGSRLEWGYSYNISQGGIYVRTLTPPGIGVDLELEFSPPHGRGRVLVSGKVAWRQEYRAGGGYPAGFGLQFSDSLPLADAAALEVGYRQLLVDNGSPEE